MGQRGRPRHPQLLTPREQDVLALIRNGLTNEQIAERLNIGFETAKSHVAEILSKLGVATREEAAAWQPGPERRWSFGRIVLALAGMGIVAAAVAGLALLAWGLTRSGGDDGSAPAITGSSTSTPAAQTSSLFPDSVWMAGATSGWLAGVEKACADDIAACGGLIFHTNDGGGSWDEQYRGQVQVSKIAFDGDQRGFAIGPTQQCSGNAFCPSGILRTTDGGLHWQEVTTTPLHLTGIGLAAGDAWLIGQQCPPGQPSSACGWYMLDSANGGDTWTQSTLPINGFALDLSRATANDAWIVTSPSGPGTAQLIATHDAGQTWQRLPGPPDGLSFEQRIFFRNASEGWLLAGSQPGAGSQPKVLYSTADGGQTWTLVSGSLTPGTGIASPGVGLTIGGYTGPMVFSSDTGGWIASLRAGLLHSTDGGANWSIALQDDNLQDMHFADADHGWAVSGITFWSTDDGGVTWRSSSLPDTANP